MFKSYFEAEARRSSKPFFSIAMAAPEVDDLPALVSPRDLDFGSNIASGYSNRNPYVSSRNPHAPMSPTDPSSSSEEIHILDVIKKIWPMNEAPLPHHQQELKIHTASKPNLIKNENLLVEPEILLPLHDPKVTGGSYSCWDFVDIMPLQRAHCQDTKATCVINSLTTETDQERDIVRTIEMVLLEGDASAQKLDQNDFKAYPLETTFLVDREVVFFVEEIGKKKSSSRKHVIRENIWKFRVELIRPDASESQLLTLFPDPYPTETASGRYFCSFYPAASGSHFLCAYVDVGSGISNVENFRQIQGSPFVIDVEIEINAAAESFKSRFLEMPLQKQTSTPLCMKAWGIAVYRPYNWIFVADRAAHEIIVLDSSDCSKILYKFGKQGSGPGQLYRPTGIAIDSVHQRVIITDKDNHRISVFGLDGDFLFNFGQSGHGNGEFAYPWGVDVSPDGEFIAVADSRNHRLQLFSPNGKFVRKFSVFESRPFDYKGEFNYPRGVAFSLTGSHIYVTDFNLQTVLVINLALTEKTTLVQPRYISIKRPQGLAVDETGNIIVTESKRNCVHVVSPNGKWISTLNKSGMGRFDTPLDVAVLKGGRLVVIDQNSRLHII